MLTQDVQAYLAVRRAMGFGMKWSGNLLRGFAAFSDATGQHHVCSDTAIKWAGVGVIRSHASQTARFGDSIGAVPMCGGPAT